MKQAIKLRATGLLAAFLFCANLVAGQVIFRHGFDNSASGHPYNHAPSLIDEHLTFGGIENSRGQWTTYTDSTGDKSIGFDSPMESTITFFIDVDSGYMLSMPSFSFDAKVEGSGYATWIMNVNNVFVGNGNLYVDPQPSKRVPLVGTGTILSDNVISGLEGRIRFDIIVNETFDGVVSIDNVTLTGYVVSTLNTLYPTGTKVNYIRSHVFRTPISTISDTVNLDWADHVLYTNYMDGLARPIQYVKRADQQSGLDYIQHEAYDSFNRRVYHYLPYAGGNSGTFRTQPIAELNAYYDTLYPSEGGNYFSRLIFDDTSLLRRTIQTRAGNFADSGIGITKQYGVNSSADGVKRWVFNGFDTSPSVSGTWGAGRLFVSETVDEAGMRVKEFTDKYGRLILSKKQSKSQPGDPHLGWLCTYYVYDGFGQLRHILPPKVVEAMAQGGNWSVSALAELCYSYGYDKHGRVIQRNQPGKGISKIVYNRDDLPVLVQDANLAASGKWVFVKYDGLGRIILKGIFNNPSGLTHEAMIAQVEGTAPMSPFIQFLTNIEDHHDYTTQSSVADCDLTEINYYDRYPASLGDFGYDDAKVQGLLAHTSQVTPVQSKETTGLLTGSCIRIMEGGEVGSVWSKSQSFYDVYGREIQMQDVNFLGGRDTVSMKYDMNGRIIRSQTSLNNPEAAWNGNVRIAKAYEYSSSNRLSRIFHQVNEEPYWRMLNTFGYDPLGRLTSELLGPVEARNYTYRIWGTLEGINRDYYRFGALAGNFHFGEQITYDDGSDPTNKLGMPSTFEWRQTGSEKSQRRYVYTYDEAERLAGAEYSQRLDGGSWSNQTENYTADNMAYDANGNLLSMDQWGTSPAYPAPFKFDQLTYEYANGGMSDKLASVSDQVPTDFKLGEFVERNGTNPVDYDYDDNGNVTSDDNRQIELIRYDFNNKPYEIVFSQGRKIEFTYDSRGTMLRKSVIENGNLRAAYTYLHGTEFRNDTLQHIQHEVGKTRPITVYQSGTPSVFYEYDYFVKDHQGNVRSVLTQKPGSNWYSPVLFNGAILNMVAQSYDPSQLGMTGFTTGLRSYVATSELASSGIEEAFFENIPETRDTKPLSTNPADEKSSRLNNTDPDRQVGPAILLRIMGGDKFELSAQSYYASSGSNYTSGQTLESIVENAVSALTAGGGSMGISEGVLGNMTTQSTNGAWSTALGDLLNATPIQTQAPRAFLTCIFLDDNLKAVPSKSKLVQSTVADQWSNLAVAEIESDQSGYLLVFVQNQSPMDVHFDDLTINHNKGVLSQETHYYPYGLAIASATVSAVDPNNFLFLGQKLHQGEFSDGTGLDWAELGNRQYDPQIGRWHSPDPLQESAANWSPYRYAFSNPAVYSDPSGLYEGYEDAYDAGADPRGGPDDQLGCWTDSKSWWQDILDDIGYHAKNAADAVARVGMELADGIEKVWVNGMPDQSSREYIEDFRDFDNNYAPDPITRDEHFGNFDNYDNTFSPAYTLFGLRVHFIFEDETPEIYQHTVDALRAHPEWHILHYNGGGKPKRANRYNATKGRESEDDDRSWDEFPYAIAEEGGGREYVFRAPEYEQDIQRSQLSVMVTKSPKMKKGDPFLVWPVPSRNTKQPVPSPAPRDKPYHVPTFPLLPVLPFMERRLIPAPIMPIIIPLVNPDYGEGMDGLQG